MILVNFSHALTTEGLGTLRDMVGESVQEICIPCQLDLEKPIERQMTQLVHEVLSQVERSAQVELVIPPALGCAAALLPLVWTKVTGCWMANLVLVSKVPDSLPPRFLPTQVVPVHVVWSTRIPILDD